MPSRAPAPSRIGFGNPFRGRVSGRRRGAGVGRHGKVARVRGRDHPELVVEGTGARELRAEQDDDAREVEEHEERDARRERAERRVVVGHARRVPGEAEAQHRPQQRRNDGAGEHLAPA